jgi:hypothetical protein
VVVLWSLARHPVAGHHKFAEPDVGALVLEAKVTPKQRENVKQLLRW